MIPYRRAHATLSLASAPPQDLSCAGPSIHPDEASGHSGRTGLCGDGSAPAWTSFTQHSLAEVALEVLQVELGV